MLRHQGFHHLGLVTHDMEATLDFYENTLGFTTRVCDVIKPEGGGAIRHAFLDAGNGELMAFMECNDVPGVAADFDAGINRGLGIADGLIHFAFEVASPAELGEKREYLQGKNVDVTNIVDHGWCQSIYFKDPNHLQLEYCCLTQTLDAGHVADRLSDDWRSLARS